MVADRDRLTAHQASMDDVAALAGVSRATVSRVIAGTVPVSEETRKRVLVAVNQLGYVPNLVAQALATKGSTLVGLLLRNPRKPVYGTLHAEIQDHSAVQGLELITVVPSSSQGPPAEQRALQKLLGLRVGGLFIATGVSHASHLAPFLGVVPVVAVGRPENHLAIHGVSHDEEANGALIATAVADHGHRAVAVLIPDEDLSVPENQRARSMVATLKARDVTVHGVNATTFGRPDEGQDEIMRLVQHGAATCAMFPSDERALFFMALCDRVGVAIPDTVSVTGIDGATLGLERIGLATVRLPVAAVAARAVSVMAELVGGVDVPVRHLRYPGELQAGTSLARPAG